MNGEVGHFLMAMRAKPIDMTVANMPKERFWTTWTGIHDSYQWSEEKGTGKRMVTQGKGREVLAIAISLTWGEDRSALNHLHRIVKGKLFATGFY